METYLPARQPFYLPSVVRSHGWIQMAPFLEEPGAGGFSYLLQLSSGRVVELHIAPAPAGVQVTAAGPISPAEQGEIRGIVTWMLDLDQDFSSFYEQAAHEPRLAKAAAQAKGRILRSATLFEDVVKTILTTNTLWAATLRMNKNLVDQFGAPLPGNPERRAFPSAQQLAETDEATLRGQTRLGYRSPYVLALARSVAGGKLDLEGLKNAELSTAELRMRLKAIKGIGDYAAANLLMLLGHYDFIPVDSWALKMVSREWYGGAPVGRAEVEGAFEGWGAWKGLAYWMWDWSG